MHARERDVNSDVRRRKERQDRDERKREFGRVVGYEQREDKSNVWDHVMALQLAFALKNL